MEQSAFIEHVSAMGAREIARSVADEFLPKKSTPLVRVVENLSRTLPLTKVQVAELDEDEGLLEEATDNVVTTLMFDAAEKLVQAACQTADYAETIPFEPVASDPEVEAMMEDLIEDIEDRQTDAALREAGLAESLGMASIANPVAERLLRTDKDDIDAGVMFDEPIETKTEEATPTVVAKETEESMKTEPIASDKAADLAKAAEERAPLSYLRSVEGRVLTIMEAAIPNDAQRDAIKTLIKKEFRREMTKANRGSFASDED